MAQVPHIFNRQGIAQKRARAAADFAAHDFLIRNTAQMLLDRLNDILRPFENILVIGSHCGLMREMLTDMGQDRDSVTVIDLAENYGADILADEEALPFAAQQFDCVISHLSLPFVNDVPGVLAQVNYSLKPDGLFLATTLGVNTLVNVQAAMMQADIDLYQGAHARVGPFIDIADAAALMQRAGFALPVIEQDSIRVLYRDFNKLMHDLRGMAWSSPQAGRGRVKGSKRYFDAVDRILKTPKEQSFEVGFDVLTLTGWAPSENQQRPLAPGSAEHRLAEALESVEHPL